MSNTMLARGQAFTRHSTETDFTYFDLLPPDLRSTLQQYSGNFSSYHAWVMLNMLGLSATVARLEHTERISLHRLAVAYKQQYGLELPHVAAGATFQRWSNHG